MTQQDIQPTPTRATLREQDAILLEILNQDGTLRSAHIIDHDEMGLLTWHNPSDNSQHFTLL